VADGFSLTEWIQKAKEDPKVAAQPLVVIVAILLLAYRFLYVPQRTLLDKETKKGKAILNEIKGLQSAVENIEEIKIQVNDLRKSWSEVEEKCYLKSDPQAFLQDIREIAKKVGLNIKNIAPQPTVPKTFETLNYEIYSVKISFAGSFQQLGKLLRAFESHKKLISVELPNLEPDASGTFKFDLLPSTILLPDKTPPSQ